MIGKPDLEVRRRDLLVHAGVSSPAAAGLEVFEPLLEQVTQPALDLLTRAGA